MKTRILLLFALLISGLTYSQTQFEIVGNTLTVTNTVTGEKDEIQKEKVIPDLIGDRLFLIGYNDKFVKYRWKGGWRFADLLQPTGETWNDMDDAVQWCLDNLGFKTGLGGSGPATTDASDLTTGELNDARLSNNVTLEGNAFNGNDQLVKLDGSGRYPALDGSLITGISGGGATDASSLTFNNVASGMNATNAQEAIDELKTITEGIDGYCNEIGSGSQQKWDDLTPEEQANFKMYVIDPCPRPSGEQWPILNALTKEVCSETNALPVAISESGFRVEVVAGDGSALQGDWVLRCTVDNIGGAVSIALQPLPNVAVNDVLAVNYSGWVSRAGFTSATTSWFGATGETNQVMTTTPTSYSQNITVTEVTSSNPRARWDFTNAQIDDVFYIGFFSQAKQ